MDTSLNLYILFLLITIVIFTEYSGGCAGAVTRILKKVDGVTDIATDVEAKSVVVTHDASVAPTLLDEKLQKWSAASGKEVRLL